MKPRAHDPRRLDVSAFAAANADLHGHWPTVELSRLHEVLAADAPPDHGRVQWSIKGEIRRLTSVEPQCWLHLIASTTVWLQCQRCLQPVAVPLQVGRALRYVRGENEAARLDAESDDDVLELTHAIDVRELVEDELLLALPLVPRHERCLKVLPMQHEADEDTESAPNPFAKLAEFKRGRPQ